MARRAAKPIDPNGPVRLQGIMPEGDLWEPRIQAVVKKIGTSRAGMIEAAVRDLVLREEQGETKDAKLDRIEVRQKEEAATLARIEAKYDMLFERIERMIKKHLDRVEAQGNLQMYINWGLLLAQGGTSTNGKLEPVDERLAIEISKEGKSAIEDVLRQLETAL